MSIPVMCKSEEIIISEDYQSDEAMEAEDHLRIALEDTGGENHHQTYYATSDNQATPTTQSTTSNTSSPARIRNSNNNIVTSGNGGSNHIIITSTGKNAAKNLMENEKRMRREIANSNERRRMQSINAGFQSLRSLLPHHEGEKLSKAAILQQTAQYIIDLEREKTHLLSQNSQLKRLLGQHEVGSGGGSGGGGGGNNEVANVTAGTIKKRKFADNVIVQAISDSSDEGLGSMSPEPVTLISNVTGATKTSNTATVTYLNVNSKEINELKGRLEAERSRRTLLEDRLRQLERQIYPSNQFIPREVIEHTDNIREEDIPVTFGQVQVVEIDSLSHVGQAQVVLCQSVDEAMHDEEEIISTDLVSNVREEVVIGEDSRDYVELSSKLQPILDAAIKAEPKVEVERINSNLTKINEDNGKLKEGSKQSNGKRMYITNTSRQNLETIVEAIRHLEGDHLFAENGSSDNKKSTSPTTVTTVTTQQKAICYENPTTATTSGKLVATVSQQRKLPVELAPFLQLKKANGAGNTVTIVGSASNTNNSSNCTNSNKVTLGTNNNSNIVTLKTSANPSNTSSETTSLPQQIRITGLASLKQCRPGVIVAKQVS